ncbi:hypothetical protein BKA70DRAFT_1241538 [Coprinopsis sp. MPI-PUGE-AT-0042]|nr:hypothetical protein BKA70DRAFT_1241538 [Coprinopsis sp. MPI-PUGE-AT-0042]
MHSLTLVSLVCKGSYCVNEASGAKVKFSSEIILEKKDAEDRLLPMAKREGEIQGGDCTHQSDAGKRRTRRWRCRDHGDGERDGATKESLGKMKPAFEKDESILASAYRIFLFLVMNQQTDSSGMVQRVAPTPAAATSDDFRVNHPYDNTKNGLGTYWHPGISPVCQRCNDPYKALCKDRGVYTLVNALTRQPMNFSAHAKGELYLRIPHTIVHPDETVQISTVEKPVTWMIIPHHRDRSKFQICLPFTSPILDLGFQPDTPVPVILFPNADLDSTWWRFERNHEASSPALQASPEPESSSKGWILGPKEQAINFGSILSTIDELEWTGYSVPSNATARPNMKGESILWGIKPNKKKVSAQDRTSGSRPTTRGAKKARNIVVRLPPTSPKGILPPAPTVDETAMLEISTPLCSPTPISCPYLEYNEDSMAWNYA